MTASRDADVLVIGAGISGLLCASRLQAAGLKVLVVDKSHGVGGRMATRRIGAARFDHGAQFFNAFRRPFQALVEDWLADGRVKTWHRLDARYGPASAPPRYCGVHGMTDVPKHLAASLDVQCSQRITTLAHADGFWRAQAESGMGFQASRLVLTAPLPQALDLLDTIGFAQLEKAYASLRHVRYARGLALLARLDQPSALPEPGYCELDAPACRWIADNQLKGISPEPCVTLHASPAFASEHWETADDDCAERMLQVAAPWLGGAKVIERVCHRWHYALPVNAWPQLFFAAPRLGLWLAGDAFGGSRVEQAACSGLAVAQELLT